MKNKTELKRIIKFALVGDTNTVVDFLAFTLFRVVIGIPETVAQGFGYTAGVINSFILNRSFTFKDKKSKHFIREFIPFVVINLVALAVSIVMMKFLPGVLEGWFPNFMPGIGKIYEYMAKVCIVPVTLVINYIGSKLFVWRNDSGEEAE